MIFLDTPAAILLTEDHQQIPRDIWPFLDQQELVISPMARLELDFLYETGRIKENPLSLLGYLIRNLNLRIETDGWVTASQIACTLNWTQDPFDRLIVAHALVWGDPLLTKNKTIREHYRHAFWDQPFSVWVES